ncbi:hypothetical protein DRO66_02545 [Candidatus Bathyarchaeota archaeon]|nr:MAG: hypothetical protein DRO66_02545 [Candidatus Bathyarchaeota archaeon]
MGCPKCSDSGVVVIKGHTEECVCVARDKINNQVKRLCPRRGTFVRPTDPIMDNLSGNDCFFVQMPSNSTVSQVRGVMLEVLLKGHTGVRPYKRVCSRNLVEMSFGEWKDPDKSLSGVIPPEKLVSDYEVIFVEYGLEKYENKLEEEKLCQLIEVAGGGSVSQGSKMLGIVSVGELPFDDLINMMHRYEFEMVEIQDQDMVKDPDEDTTAEPKILEEDHPRSNSGAGRRESRVEEIKRLEKGK